MYLSSSPTLNLHGETTATLTFIVNDFINDNYKLEKEYIGFIHGRSSNILRNKLQEILKKNKYVDSFRVDTFNPGLTIVKLKIKNKS